MIEASINGQLDIVKVLIEKTAQLDEKLFVLDLNMSCFCSVIYSNFNISQYLIENFFTHITSFNSFKKYSEVLKNVLAVVENDPGYTQNFDIFFDNFSHFIKLIYDHSKNENLPFINYTF